MIISKMRLDRYKETILALQEALAELRQLNEFSEKRRLDERWDADRSHGEQQAFITLLIEERDLLKRELGMLKLRWRTAYGCKFCGGLHVGHPPGHVRAAIRARQEGGR